MLWIVHVQTSKHGVIIKVRHWHGCSQEISGAQSTSDRCRSQAALDGHVHFEMQSGNQQFAGAGCDGHVLRIRVILRGEYLAQVCDDCVWNTWMHLRVLSSKSDEVAMYSDKASQRVFFPDTFPDNACDISQRDFFPDTFPGNACDMSQRRNGRD